MARPKSRAAARARQRRKPLSKAQRRARSPRPPDGAALAYAIALRSAVAAYATKVRAALLPKLEVFALREEQRADAESIDAEAAKVIQSVASEAIGAAVARAKSAIRKVPDAVERHSKAEFKRVGINVRAEPKMGKAMDAWRKANVQKVQGLLDKELRTLERLLRESEGRTPKQLADRIEERLDVTRSKAEFLARDQTLTLNGQITQARQVAAGIEEFDWTTSNDERVRESHAELDGKRFRWDDPPIVDGEPSIPGEPPMCRCTATPVLPELE